MAITTAGSDARTVRSTLDRVASFIGQSADALVVDVAVEVLPWAANERAYIPTDSDGEPR
jgi:hypothetical protein